MKHFCYHLCIPTLGDLDKLNKCLYSVYESSLRPAHVFILNNGKEEIYHSNLPKDNIQVDIFKPEVNYGVAQSWNYFLHKVEDYIVIANDDIEVQFNTIRLLVDSANEFPDYLIHCICEHPQWALFLQRKRSLSVIGEYDSFFYPSYFEDADYNHRMRCAGEEVIHVPNARLKSHDGSKSKTGEWNALPHVNKLRKYYDLKWGGGPWGWEKYRKAFNL